MYYYNSGAQYEGAWDMNNKHGHGKMMYANGDVYEGDWVSDQRSGLGTLTLCKALLCISLCVCLWVMSVRVVCILVHTLPCRGSHSLADCPSPNPPLTANGDVYNGHWLADKKEGPGRYFYVATRKMYEGEWVDDVAKCGVFSDIPFEPEEPLEPHPEDNVFALPKVPSRPSRLR